MASSEADAERIRKLEAELDDIELGCDTIVADSRTLPSQRREQAAIERKMGILPPAMTATDVDARVNPPRGAAPRIPRRPEPVLCTPSECSALRRERSALLRQLRPEELIGTASLAPPDGVLSDTDVKHVLEETSTEARTRTLLEVLPRRTGGFEALLLALRSGAVQQFDAASLLEAAERDERDAAQREALTALYEATQGERHWAPGRRVGWLDTLVDLGAWHGVGLGMGLDTGRVVSLKLGRAGLRGSIPDAITTLVSLVDLHLDNNDLVGHIPRDIGALSRLRNLVLCNNQLSGTLPASLGMLAELEFFSARNNRLTGVVPDAMRGCGCLSELYLHDNALQRVDDAVAMLHDTFGDDILFRLLPQRPA